MALKPAWKAALMRRRYKPFPILEGEQAEAVDPKIHAALSGVGGDRQDAGADRTRARLLLSGARPETILCITFTKAAAAEMANRISAQLAAWVRLPDKDLKKDLFALREPDTPIVKERARRLFAKVLEAPGGLRIQTIHSFAQTLARVVPRRGRDRAGVPADRRPRRAGAGTDDARHLARGRGEPRQHCADRRCAMPQPAPGEKAQRSII